MGNSGHSDEHNLTIGWVLWAVLLINAGMFVIEISFGLMTHSNALISDSLDMLADALIYATSIFVLASTHIVKARVSLLKGAFMGLLGLLVVYEIVQKILNPVIPDASVIAIIGVISLIANIASAILLLRFRDNDLNIKSAWICSRNDAITSISVIIAGLLVIYFNSAWPDIIIGAGIAALVFISSFGVIKESWGHIGQHED